MERIIVGIDGSTVVAQRSDEDMESPVTPGTPGAVAGTTPTDRNGLVVLDRADCLRLLSTATLGRVGLCMRALPIVLPVNFVVDGDRVIIRTGAGSKLEAAMERAVVAFEVDDIDPVYHEGWSVVVTGMAEVVSDPGDIARLEHLPLRPWSTVPGDTFLSIRTELLSGRRLTPETAGAVEHRRPRLRQQPPATNRAASAPETGGLQRDP